MYLVKLCLGNLSFFLFLHSHPPHWLNLTSDTFEDSDVISRVFTSSVCLISWPYTPQIYQWTEHRKVKGVQRLFRIFSLLWAYLYLKGCKLNCQKQQRWNSILVFSQYSEEIWAQMPLCCLQTEDYHVQKF